LAFGVAVAAAAVCDAQVREDELERAGGERRAVVGAQRERPRLDGALGRGTLDQADGLGGTAAEPRCQPTISRVQQSIAVIR
jgi:hypothetical protein